MWEEAVCVEQTWLMCDEVREHQQVQPQGDGRAQIFKARPAAAADPWPDRAELKAELKQELMAELKSETKADIQEATVGLRSVLRADFKDEIRTETMQEDISSAVEEALAGSAIMGGLFKGATVGGFIDTNFMYNLRNSGENATNRNANSNARLQLSATSNSD